MIKIARLPNPTFAVADLDSSGERLSRVPPRDTDAEQCRPALSKSAGPWSTGVEAMKMRVRYLILAIALLCLLALPSTALAADNGDSAKIDGSVTTVLEATGGDVAVPVLVYTEPDAAAVVADAVPDGVATTQLTEFDAVAAYLTQDEIQALSSEDSVDMIVSDNPVFGLDYASSLDVTNLAIGLDRVAAPATGGPTGAGVGVAVVDSGVATTSPDLANSRIVAWKDFVNGKLQPYDDAGHGTFVAGLIAGDGTASLPLDQGGYADVQYRGVAPAADIIGVKVLDATGQGRASAVMSAVLWAVVHKDQYNIKVLNLSIGTNVSAPVEYDPIASAVEFAWKHGITVVCAAGNEGEFGPGGVTSPGNSPYVITVGASDTGQTESTTDDIMTYYSSVGPTLFDEYAKPDVVAPGNHVISIRARGSYIDVNFSFNQIPVATYAPTAPAGTEMDYLSLSGTSTSAPVTAGAVALLLSADPTLTPDDIKLRLMNTADPLPDSSRYQQGAGAIDVAAALSDTSRANGYALSEDLGDGMTILDRDVYSAWDQRVWSKYGWTKSKWSKFQGSKFKWSKFKWSKFKWSDVGWSKFKWSKFKWSDVAWSKFKWSDFDSSKFKWSDFDSSKFKWSDFDWSKFKWSDFDSSKFKWSEYDWAKFKWSEYEWAKFKWSILLQGQ
jgi:serine protease AprX